MRFIETALSGVFEISVERHSDSRGSFERTYCADEFSAHGLELPDRQCAISRNLFRHTLRGLHIIPEGEGEAKLVRCLGGRVLDVAVDLRLGSPTKGRHVAVELSPEDGNALFLPRGVAHGFMTLQDNSDLLYHFSMPYRPGLETGIRWDDPDVAVHWPATPSVMSERDSTLPSLRDSKFA